MPYYAQNGEDQWLDEHWERLRLPSQGVFVEVGVGDGTSISNSLWLEERGWTGLLVEPDPRQHEKIRATRKTPLAPYAAGGYQRPFVAADCPELSGFLRQKSEGMVLDVSILYLSEILDLYNIDHVDVLSIDTEGTEIEVWNSLCGRFRPRIVFMEWYTDGMPNDADAIKKRMSQDGYDCTATLGCNLVLERRA